MPITPAAGPAPSGPRPKGGRIRLSLAVLALSAAPPALVAAQAPGAAPTPQQSAPLSPSDALQVRRAEEYLQSLRAAEGRFTQIDPKGHRSEGSFYIQRPGRARFAYDGDKGLLVVSDGDAVSVYDRKLKSFDQYPLEQTPLVLLLGDRVNLETALSVVAVTQTPGGFLVEARDARRSAPGRLILEFASTPISLRGWAIIDAQKQKTTVRLTRLERRTRLPAGLFVLKEPNDVGGGP